MSTDSPIRVAFLPTYANPYQRLLAGGLAGHDVAVEMVTGLPSAGWLRARRGELDILHLHWLDGLYMARWRTPWQVSAFVNRWRLARALGYRLVWTAHNVLPHRPVALTPVHVAIRRLVMAQADAVIAHCAAGRRELLARFPRSGPVAVIPLGSYAGVYPTTAGRATARAALGLPESSFVYLALGNIAAYKGLERFAAAFRATAGDDDVAIIAGRNRDARLVRRLQQAAGADPRLRLRAEFIPDQAMQPYLAAADVVVAPFERILTSSTVMVALSYGRPVIVPDLGCLPELVRDAGLIYRADDPGGLADALRAIKRADRTAMSVTGLAIAAGLGWDDIGRQTAGLYRAVLGAS